MAYASAVALTVTEITRAGVAMTTLPTTPTATHGNKFANDGRTWVEIANASGGDVVATINTPGSVDGFAIAELTVTIANGARKAIGPFTSIFNQSDGYVWVVCDVVSSVTMGAFRLQNP